MTFGDYLWFYGSLYFVLAVGAYMINSHWPNTIPESFILANAILAFGAAIAGVTYGLLSFGQWVIHLFK